ncbi:hypothetical protein [Streptomyces sp. NPDC006270]|uniref:hypothetical protein n=1 Tax=Streptomyces sp. NPDC006270 TaxID=3364741 RepID=UPI0036C3C2BD
MALHLGTWDVDFRPQGWIRFKESDGGPTVYLQFRQSGPLGQERFDMESVVMERGDEDTLSGRTWRRIPFSDLESLLRDPEITDILTAPCDVSAPSLGCLDEYFEATEHLSNVVVGLSSGVMRGDGVEGEPRGGLPVVRAPQGRLTDEHLQDVADAYRWFTNASKSPAPAIADMAGVPVRTVHRWVYEARKRGFLPPARAGRAG